MIISAVGGRIKSRVPVNAIGRSERDGISGKRGDIRAMAVAQRRDSLAIRSMIS
jgi:hypothetical protein